MEHLSVTASLLSLVFLMTIITPNFCYYNRGGCQDNIFLNLYKNITFPNIQSLTVKRL